MHKWNNCRVHQNRTQWVIILSEGNKDGQIDLTQHMTYLQDTHNSRAEPLRADNKGNGSYL